jgi:hypothetical protein
VAARRRLPHEAGSPQRERAMSDLIHRTLRNPRWWLVVLPLGIVASPLVLLDLSLALLCYLLMEASEAANTGRQELSRAWRYLTSPLRRWAYGQRRGGGR